MPEGDVGGKGAPAPISASRALPGGRKISVCSSA